MTPENIDMLVRLNSAVHRSINEASAELYKALAVNDADAVKTAAKALREAIVSAMTCVLAIDDLARRL